MAGSPDELRKAGDNLSGPDECNAVGQQRDLPTGWNLYVKIASGRGERRILSPDAGHDRLQELFGHRYPFDESGLDENAPPSDLRN